MTETVYCHAALNHAGAEGLVALEVAVRDARQVAREWSYARQGFQLLTLPSTVQDWTSLPDIEAVHYDEVAQWARAFTGCGAVLFYPALVRNPRAAAHSADFAPIEFAHSDYTEDYATMLKDPAQPYHAVVAPSMRRAGVSDADLASVSRVLTLQLWRNVGPARPTHPLCLCDAQTVPRSQLATVRVESYGGLETQFDAFALLPPEQGTENRWYTFPAMQRDEVIVFRAFDSDRVADGTPFWTPHCAFQDPNSDGSARHSVEMRAICLFW